MTRLLQENIQGERDSPNVMERNSFLDWFTSDKSILEQGSFSGSFVRERKSPIYIHLFMAEIVAWNCAIQIRHSVVL